MKSPEKRCPIILFAACVALLLLSCDDGPKQAETAPPPAKVEVIALQSGGAVVSVSGGVSVKGRQSSAYVPLSPEQVLNPGDVIEIRKGGSVSIRFIDGMTAVLEAETRDRWVKFQ